MEYILATPAPAAPSPPCTTTLATPEGWESLGVYRTRPVAFTGDRWVVDADGGVVDSVGWATVGASPLAYGLVRDVDERDGVLWAVTETELGWLEDGQWQVVPVPPIGGARDLVARADGTVAVFGPWYGYYGGYRASGYRGRQEWAVWEGTRWRVEQAVISEDPWVDVAETGSGRLIAVGSDVVHEWDGATWTVLPWEEAVSGYSYASLVAVAAEGEQIAAVGYGGLVIRGTRDALVGEWVGSERFAAVDLGPDGSVVALTVAWEEEPTVWRHDGDGWAAYPLPEDGEWVDVAATGSGVRVVGDRAGPTVLLLEGETWTEEWHVPGLGEVSTVAVDGAGAVWLGGADAVGRWDGALATWAVSGPILAAGAGGDVVASDGWSSLSAFTGDGWRHTAVADTVADVTIGADGVAFAGGTAWLPYGVEGAAVLRREGEDWVADSASWPVPYDPVVALHAADTDTRFALTESGRLLVGDAAAWTAVADVGKLDDAAWVWGRATDDVYTSYVWGVNLPWWNGAEVVGVPDAPGQVVHGAGDAEQILVSASTADGSVASLLVDGAWTEVARGECELTVDLRDGTAVIAATDGVWRSTLLR